MKTCAACRHAHTLPDQPKYLRCRAPDANPIGDGALCGEMRQTEACGPDAKLWEPKDGQATEA